jgi:YgiT-type zinc finger domain-containing protein
VSGEYPDEDTGPAPDPTVCQSCGRPTQAAMVHVTMWTDKGLVVIENVPARVCDPCQEQYYDEDTSARILGLASSGFPRSRMIREITVPVFSLDAAAANDQKPERTES